MLTKLEFKMYYYCGWLVSALQIFPFSFNHSATYKLSTKRNIFKAIWGIVNVSLTAAHLMLLLMRFVPPFGYTKQEFEHMHWSIVIHAIELVAFVSALGMQIGGIVCSSELASLANQLLVFNTLNANRYTTNSRRYGHAGLREKLINGLAFQLGLLALLLPCLNIVAPNSKFTLYSVLSVQLQSRWTILFCATLEAFSWIKACLTNWYLFITGFSYIMTNNYWLDKISLEFLPQRTVELANVSLLYKSLRTLNTIYNNGFGSILFPIFKLNVEFVALFCLYAALRYSGSLNLWVHIFILLCGPFTIIQSSTAIMYMACTYEKSLMVKSNLDHSVHFMTEHKDECKRIAKTCRPIACKLGSLFFVEKSTKLDYISMGLDAFIQVLLATI